MKRIKQIQSDSFAADFLVTGVVVFLILQFIKMVLGF